METPIDEYYFYACEYMAKTELYDRTLTNERSSFDPTSALLSNGWLRRISYEYCLKLRKYFTDICGGTFRFIKEEINKHSYYTAQMWINEYYRLKEIKDENNNNWNCSSDNNSICHSLYRSIFE